MATLHRYGAPNKFDHFPCGTLCKVSVGLDGQFEIYKQISHDEENPIWELLDLQDQKNRTLVITACEK